MQIYREKYALKRFHSLFLFCEDDRVGQVHRDQAQSSLFLTPTKTKGVKSKLLSERELCVEKGKKVDNKETHPGQSE